MARLKGCHWSASSDVTWTSTIGSRPALLFSTLRESLSTRSLTSDILRPPGPPSESCARSGRSRSRSGFGCGGEKWTPALNYVSEAGPASVEDFFLSVGSYILTLLLPFFLSSSTFSFFVSFPSIHLILFPSFSFILSHSPTFLFLSLSSLSFVLHVLPVMQCFSVSAQNEKNSRKQSNKLWQRSP